MKITDRALSTVTFAASLVNTLAIADASVSTVTLTTATATVGVTASGASVTIADKETP